MPHAEVRCGQAQTAAQWSSRTVRAEPSGSTRRWTSRRAGGLDHLYGCPTCCGWPAPSRRGGALTPNLLLGAGLRACLASRRRAIVVALAGGHRANAPVTAFAHRRPGGTTSGKPMTSRNAHRGSGRCSRLAARQSRYQQKCAPSRCMSCSGGNPASIGNRSSGDLIDPGARSGNGEERLRCALPVEPGPPRWRQALRDERCSAAVDFPRVRSWRRAGPQGPSRSARPRRRAGPPGRGSGPGAAGPPAAPASPRCAGRNG